MPSIARSVVPLLFAASLTMACAPRAPSSSAQQLEDARVAVLPASEGLHVFGVCSPAPGDGRDAIPTEFWVPDAATVREVDARLSAVLDSVLPLVARANGMEEEPRAGQYHRQYVGIVREGERLVFVQGVHEDVVRAGGVVGEGFPRWRTEAVDDCGRGAGLFAIVYDPRAGTFNRLGFSAAMGGDVTY